MMLCAAVSGIVQQLAVHIEEVRICLSAGMNLGAGISRKTSTHRSPGKSVAAAHCGIPVRALSFLVTP